MKPFASLKLPYAFDGDRLDLDLETALRLHWQDHFNQADYAGGWKIIALRSENGREDSVTSKDLPGYRDTPLLAHCPYFKEIIDEFYCEKQAVRLMQLAPGSRIHAHRDRGLCYADGFFRLHIPIRTHEQVFFYVDERRVPMRRGECWYADFNELHRVENLGSEPRIHLVLDCLRNAWSDELFTRAGFDLAALDKPRYRREDISQIIAQLEAMGTETALKMAEEMRKEAQ